MIGHLPLNSGSSFKFPFRVHLDAHIIHDGWEHVHLRNVNLAVDSHLTRFDSITSNYQRYFAVWLSLWTVTWLLTTVVRSDNDHPLFRRTCRSSLNRIKQLFDLPIFLLDLRNILGCTWCETVLMTCFINLALAPKKDIHIIKLQYVL